MKNLNDLIESHYLKEGLYEDIVGRLQEQGIDLTKVTRADIAGVDEFHVRGAAISKELAKLTLLAGAKVLDVGCGLGGPCRMLASEYNCQSTGIDLSKEYIRTAQKLSKLVGLNDKTTFVQGDATSLPFEDGYFDTVWTQHVQMNIPDKQEFYSEINRVLKKGGHFLYYDIFKKDDGKITYPMPWASSSEFSFLFKESEMDSILQQLGLSKEQAINQTSAGVKFIEGLTTRMQTSGPPKIGLNVLMGQSTRSKLTNLMTHLKMGKLELKSGVYKK